MKDYYGEDQQENPILFSDLAVERRRADVEIPGIEFHTEKGAGGNWECVKIKSAEGAASIGRPIGTYDTLNTGRMELMNDDDIADATEEVARKLCQMLTELDVIPERILVVGLGNRNLTPDSVGPKAAETVRPTMHIKEFDEDTFDALECSEIAILSPGVSGMNGIDAAEIVKGVSRRISPDVVIAIDAIASRSVERLGSTVQISDTGIFPGSGVGNTRKALSEKTLGIPVISIGVPTVIDSRAFKGSFEPRDGRYGMLVAPKEIDEITNVAAKIVGEGINQAFGICSF